MVRPLSQHTLVVVALLIVLVIVAFLSCIVIAAAPPSRRFGRDSSSSSDEIEKLLRDRLSRIHQAQNDDQANERDHRGFRDRLNHRNTNINQYNDIINSDYTDEDVYIRSSPHEELHNNNNHNNKRRTKQPWTEQRAHHGRADMPHFDSMMDDQVHLRRFDRHRGNNYDNNAHVPPRFDDLPDSQEPYHAMDDLSERMARLSERLRRQRSPSFSDNGLKDDSEYGTAPARNTERQKRDEPIDTDKLIQEMRERQEQLKQQREKLRKDLHERYQHFHRPQPDSSTNNAAPSSEATETTPTATDSKITETVADAPTTTTTSVSSTTSSTTEIPAATNTILPETPAAADAVPDSVATHAAADPIVAAAPVATNAVDAGPATTAAMPAAIVKPEADILDTIDPAQTPQSIPTSKAAQEPLAKTIETIAEPVKQN